MATLLDLCTRALDDISSFNVPTFVIGNTEDDTARTLLGAARKVGEELVRDYDWQELSRTATVATVVSTSLYDLEDDYERIASDTMWDGTLDRRMLGNTTRRQWAAISNVANSAQLTYRWRLFGGQIQVYPTPTSVFSFNYEYLSKSYCESTEGVDRTDGWVADTDEPLLPADLFIHGIRYYFGESKNLPGVSKWGAEYDAVISSRQGKNTPSQAVNMSAGIVPLKGGLVRPHYFNDLVVE